jgi:mRNA-degrading endonuclease toxin of MazEF toxin-antitoxin module
MSPATRGEVWLADLGEPRDDHEQALRRPVIILQTDDLSPLSTVVIIPFTTTINKGWGWRTLSSFRRKRQDWRTTRLPSVLRFAHWIAAS